MPLIPPGTSRIDHGDGVCGPYTAALLSDTGGLTQFGAFIETLPPGSASSTLHWHAQEDEMVHILTGTVTLIEGDMQTAMHPGDTACFQAGIPVGHCLRNDVTYPLTGDTLTIRDGIKTYRDADGTITHTAPYHGA
jgi:uncharacterized cupin superfamily protein